MPVGPTRDAYARMRATDFGSHPLQCSSMTIYTAGQVLIVAYLKASSSRC